MSKSNKFSPEVRERAVRMVQEHRGEYPSLWAAIESIAPKIGCVPQTLNDWVKKAESEQALQTVLQLVQEFGFTAQQVFPWKPQPKKVAAKYRDPATGATWSGRGKPPQWIAGKDRTPFVIA